MNSHLWIWNSMARRRRSASDIFEENGLSLLKSFLENKSFSVKVIDWATIDGYNSLSPAWLKIINHYLVLVQKRLSKYRLVKHSIAKLIIKTQHYLGKIQKERLQKKLAQLAKEVAKEHIPIFGIKVWYGEAFTMSKYLADKIHQYSPETVIVAGGYHATLYEEDILKYSNFDLAVAGSGEYPLSMLLQLINSDNAEHRKETFLQRIYKTQKNKPIPGLIYRQGKRICKNPKDLQVVFQNNELKYLKNSGKIKVHVLIESTGCPWNACNFCVHNKFSPEYRSRKVSEIISEIRSMLKQNIGLFRFAGSDTPPAYGKLIAKTILENNLQLEYTMGCRAVSKCKTELKYQQTVESFKVMIESGLRGIFIGGETGNDLINTEIMNKGIDSEDIEHTVKAMREAEILTGIKCTVSLAMIYPTPLTDSITDNEVFVDNLKLIKMVQPDAVMVTPPGPFKSTSWFCESEKYGFVLQDNFIPKMMEYEYVLYKPLELWPEIPFSLEGTNFKQMLAATQKLKNTIEQDLGIPTDLSDEHFLMIRSLGQISQKRIWKFKKKSQLSIVTSNYSYINHIGSKINAYSRQLATKNR